MSSSRPFLEFALKLGENSTLRSTSKSTSTSKLTSNPFSKLRLK
jgi:hypothetical protein